MQLFRFLFTFGIVVVAIVNSISALHKVNVVHQQLLNCLLIQFIKSKWIKKHRVVKQQQHRKKKWKRVGDWRSHDIVVENRFYINYNSSKVRTQCRFGRGMLVKRKEKTSKTVTCVKTHALFQFERNFYARSLEFRASDREQKKR